MDIAMPRQDGLAATRALLQAVVYAYESGLVRAGAP
jgi:CheY-like chemotaxis protein